MQAVIIVRSAYESCKISLWGVFSVEQNGFTCPLCWKIESPWTVICNLNSLQFSIYQWRQQEVTRFFFPMFILLDFVSWKPKLFLRGLGYQQPADCHIMKQILRKNYHSCIRVQRQTSWCFLFVSLLMLILLFLVGYFNMHQQIVFA